MFTSLFATVCLSAHGKLVDEKRRKRRHWLRSGWESCVVGVEDLESCREEVTPDEASEGSGQLSSLPSFPALAPISPPCNSRTPTGHAFTPTRLPCCALSAALRACCLRIIHSRLHAAMPSLCEPQHNSTAMHYSFTQWIRGRLSGELGPVDLGRHNWCSELSPVHS